MGQWYAIETNVKCEEKAARNLRLAGFRAYSPLARTVVWNKRKQVHVVRERWLMPRYLFVETQGEVPWGFLRACEGVRRVIGADGRPIALGPRDVKALLDVIAAEANYEFDTTRAAKIRRGEIGKNKAETARLKFHTDDMIKITNGPVAQFDATVITVTGKGKLQALISVFGRLTEITVDSEWAELDQAAEAA